MPSPVYQYVISLLMSLPIMRGPGVFMNVSVWENHALNNWIFYVAKCTILDHYHYYPDVNSHSQLSV